MLVAFIPARSGSKRIEGKNIKRFCGHPLIAYAIQGALDANLFDGVYVSSDSQEIGRIALHYGARFIHRPAAFSSDTSPDVEWIQHALELVPAAKSFAVLRPTSPFRTGETIRRAYHEWDKCSIMKAVEPVSQHPGKMWVVPNGEGGFMYPLWPDEGHLCQSNTLFKVWVQNASLEFRPNAPARFYQAFVTKGYEGLDINKLSDWFIAEELAARWMAKTPQIERMPYYAMSTAI